MLPFLPAYIPGLLQTFPFILAFALACAGALRRHAGAFYLGWGAVVALASWSGAVADAFGEAAPAAVLLYDAGLESLEASSPLLSTLLTLTTSSYAGVSFFLIVMFAGALRPSPAVRRLMAARSELSILGGIVVCGHVLRVFDFPLNFSSPVFSAVWGPASSAWMLAATAVIGPVLTCFFLAGWVSSFPPVRRRMAARSWKRLQRATAYPFMGLMLAQGFCLAVGHALIAYPWDGARAQHALAEMPTAWLSSFALEVATAAVYAMLGVFYLALRLNRRSEERARRGRAGAGTRGGAPGLTEAPTPPARPAGGAPVPTEASASDHSGEAGLAQGLVQDEGHGVREVERADGRGLPGSGVPGGA